MKPNLLSMLILCLLLSFLPTQPVAQAASDDVPVTLTADKAIRVTAADPALYWQVETVCRPMPPAVQQEVRIVRSRTTGLEPRTVFLRQTLLPAGSCTPQPPGATNAAEVNQIATPSADGYRIRSNIIADATHLYWMDSSGLVRFALNANPSDSAETLLPKVAGTTPSELVMDTDRIFGYSDGHLWQMNKVNPGEGNAIGFSPPEMASQLSYDGEFLYMIWGANRSLRRFGLDNSVATIANNVKTYVAMGSQIRFNNTEVLINKFVYYVPNSGTEIVRYDNIGGNSVAIYNSAGQLPQGYNGMITALAMGDRPTLNSLRLIFFNQRRTQQCGGFVCPAKDFLFRIGGGGGAVGAVYSTDQQVANLQSSGNFIFWNELPPLTPIAGPIRRLPKDAAILPSINLRVTGLHITQGVQKPDNRVRLIQYRPTFVRLFVKSDGVSVADVSARLTASWGGGERETIAPTRRGVTVQQYPNNDTLDHGFLFEIPAHWTLHNGLTLKASLNPFGFPLEPTFNDNVVTYGPFNFDPAPDFRILLLRTAYYWDNKDGNATNDFYRSNDLDQIESWLWRGYPLGLRPGSETISFLDYRDDVLGLRTREFNTVKECQYLFDDKNKNGKVDPGETDNRNLCASYYLHDRLLALRNELKLPKDHYIYASVVGLARGSASGSGPVANGPDLSAGAFATAGFYAGHEIGHLLGRGHPAAMSGNYPGCGHSADDPNFPYVFNWIGEGGAEATAGFDSRLWVPGGVARRHMRYFDVREVMGYCNTPDQWLSDYTYNGIYDRLRSNPGPQFAVNAASLLEGDWLSIYGALWPESQQGAINEVRRVSAILDEATEDAGAYAVQQIDANGALLATRNFATTAVADSQGVESFALTMPFVTGASTVQVIHVESGAVIASQTLSPNSPQITLSTVAAAQSQETITLDWEASDPDGDTLSYDVLYSADGGATFAPVLLGLNESQAQIDSDIVPGGEIVFQVVAYDGVNTTQINSVAMTVAAKPPRPVILQPADGAQFQYGQPINFSGYASDLQDGTLSEDATLVWSNQLGLLGTGAQLTISELPLGLNTITLQATNSLGISQVQSINLTVGDDLAAPPPLLSLDTMSLGWQVAVDTTEIQSATVELSNSGGETTLNWTVSSDVNWLSFEPANGNVPASFLVNADPTGMAGNSNSTATITILARDATGVSQSRTIPVTIQVGAGKTWSPPAEPEAPTPEPTPEPSSTPEPSPAPDGTLNESSVFLPLVQR